MKSNIATIKKYQRKLHISLEKSRQLNAEIDDILKQSDHLDHVIENSISLLQEKIYPGLNLLSIRNLLCDQFSANQVDWIPNFLASAGSGPWEEGEFDSFLQQRNIDLYDMPSEAINGIILGAQEWSSDTLSEQLHSRQPGTLKIYTQELFALGLIIGRDPFEVLSHEASEEIINNHSAIQFIRDYEDSWPPKSPGVKVGPSGSFEPDTNDWADASTLKIMGYHVGSGGPTEAERRKVLEKILTSSRLPGVESSDQIKKWGTPTSAQRLHTIASFINWLVKLQGANKLAAKEKWQSDLKWLKTRYASIDTSHISPKGSTPLSSAPAWPFSTKTPDSYRSIVDKNESYISAKRQNEGFRPKHALAVIIGDHPRATIEQAVADLKDYVIKNNMIKENTNLIQANDQFFALVGQMYTKPSELMEIVKNNMNQINS